MKKQVSKRKQPSQKPMDGTFFLLVIIALSFGLIMLLSASAPTANTKFGNSYHFFIRQFGFGMAGFLIMLAVSKIDYHIYKKYTKIMMIAIEILLLLVLIPGIGIDHNGARRWLKTGFEWQPSEFMKPVIAMFFAAMIETKKTDFRLNRKLAPYVRDVFPYMLWIGITALLLMMETHLSGTIIIVGIACTLIIVSGFPVYIFAGAGVVLFPIAFKLLQHDPVRWRRVMNFRNPFADMQDAGYQVVQGLYAISTGGLFGLGLGQSVQKYTYLPEPYNDFIFAIVCEELGLIGGMLVMILFAGLVIRGIKIATEAPDTFGCLTVVGIMAQVGIQTILNIAVATSSIPNTGVALPFFSYGGTALMALLAEMGIVLNVSRQSRKQEQI